jgi:hypothetical protein
VTATDAAAPAGAPTIDELLIADEPARWEALGFELDGDRCQLGAVRLRFAGASAGRGIVGWSLREISPSALDGLTSTASQTPMPAVAGAHPNGVDAIDHVVAVSPDLRRTVSALEAAGLALRRIRERPSAAGAPRQAFFRLGAEILEVVQDPAGASQPDRPARLWGLALRCGDLELTAAALGERLGEIRPAVQPGRRIATIRRSAGLSVPVALITPRADGR